MPTTQAAHAERGLGVERVGDVTEKQQVRLGDGGDVVAGR
jgi:hypothetical protein